MAVPHQGSVSRPCCSGSARRPPITHGLKRSGRPVDFGDEQRACRRGRNVVVHGFGKLKRVRGIAMRSDKLPSSYHAGSASTRSPLAHPRNESHAVGDHVTRPALRRPEALSARTSSASCTPRLVFEYRWIAPMRPMR